MGALRQNSAFFQEFKHEFATSKKLAQEAKVSMAVYLGFRGTCASCEHSLILGGTMAKSALSHIVSLSPLRSISSGWKSSRKVAKLSDPYARNIVVSAASMASVWGPSGAYGCASLQHPEY